MSGDLGSLVVSLTAETAQFKDALVKAAYQMDQSTGAMVASTNGLRDALGAVDAQLANFGINLRNVLGLAAAGGFAGLISSSIESAAHVQILSQQTGIFVEQLAAMKPAAAASGISLDDVAKASVKLSKTIETGNDETGKAAAAFKALGLNMADLKGQSAADQMHTVAVALNGFEDSGRKAAAATILMSRAGAENLPFLKAYAEQVNLTKTGYAEFAANAHEFEVSLGRLKAASMGIVNHFVADLLPVLLKIIDGLDRFKNIIYAALIAFGALPVVATAAAGAYTLLSTALAANAVAAEMGMVQTNLLTTSLWGTSVAATAASGALGALQVAGGVLFAAFAGWQIGSWLTEQFLSARLAGIAFVDGTLAGWEYIKYGAGVAWEGVKALFAGAVNMMREDFADFIANIGRGFAAIGAGDTAQVMADLADSIRPAVSAADGFAEAEKNLAAQRDKAVGAVHDITNAMVDDAIAAEAAKTAHEKVKKSLGDIVAPAKAVVSETQKFIDKLTEQAATVGLSERGLNLYKAAQLGATSAALPLIDTIETSKVKLEEQKAAIKAATDEYKAGEVAAKSYADALTTWSNKTLTDWANGNQLIATQNELIGASKLAIDLRSAADQFAYDFEHGLLVDALADNKNYTTALKAEYDKRVAYIYAGAEKTAMLEQIDAEVKAMKDAADATQKTYEETSKSINKSLTDAIYNGFTHGKSLAEDFKNALQTMFKNLILKPVLQPVSDYLAGLYQQGSGALAGLFGAGGMFGSAASGAADLSGTVGGGAASNWGGAAAGGLARGSWAGALGGAAIGGAITSQYGSKSPYPGIVAGGVIGYAAVAGIAAAGTALAAGATAATAATTAFAAAAAAVPVIGWIVAAVAIIASFAIKPGGGPKTGGSSVGTFGADGAGTYARGDFYTPNQSDADMQKAVTGMGQSYFGHIAELGGKAAAVAFGIGYDTDPQGTAQNRLSTSVAVDGKQVYGFRDMELGRDGATLQARMAVEAQRMILAAVQASQLPDDVAQLLDSLAPSALGSTEIQNVLAYAAAFHSLPQTIKDALAGISGLDVTTGTSINLTKFGAAYGAVQAIAAGNPGEDAQAAVDAAGQTSIEKFRAQGDALAKMAAAFDGSADAALNLAQATATYYQNQVQLLAALVQASAVFHASILDAERSIKLDTFDNAGKIGFYRDEVERNRAALTAGSGSNTTMDPSEVARLGDQSKTDLLAWWALLDQQQKTENYTYFTGQLDVLDAQVTDANRAIADAIKAQNDPSNPASPIGQVKGAFDKFIIDMNAWLDANKGATSDQIAAAQQMSDAAGTMQSAADTMQTAANTPSHIDLTVNGSEVTAGGGSGGSDGGD